MSRQTYLKTQAVELRHLLELAKEDPVMAPQIRVRLQEVERELNAIDKRPGTLHPDAPSAGNGSQKANAAAEEANVVHETITVAGTCRGILLESGRFEFRTESGVLIGGTISNEFGESEVGRLASLLNRPCEMTLAKTSHKFRGAPGERMTFVLLAARALEAIPAATH